MLAWAGIVLFGVIAALATIHLGRDVLAVVTRISGLGALRDLGVAGAAIVAGAAGLLLVARLHGRGARGPVLAVAAGIITLIVLRLAIAAAYDGVLSGEPGVYHNLARDVLEGRCCGAEPVNRPVGYPILLAGAYALAGQTAVAAEGLNLLLSLLAGLTILALARGLYGPLVGAVALMCYALWPAGALMVTPRLPHVAYDLAIVAGAWVVVAAPRGWRGSAIAGVILGLSHYVRPTTPALLPAFMLARLWRGGSWRSQAGAAVLPMLAAFLAILVPVMAWNMATRGVPDISTSAYGGHSLFIGTDERNGGRWSRAASDELDDLAGPDTWERSRIGSQIALERIRTDPVGIAILGLRKQYTLWGSESFGVRYGIKRDLASRPYRPRSVLPSLSSGLFYAAITAATAVGLYLRRRQLDALSVLLIGTAATVSAVHALVEVRDRYHAYVIPLLLPIAAVAIVELLRRVRLLGPAMPEGTIATEGLAGGTQDS